MLAFHYSKFICKSELCQLHPLHSPLENKTLYNVLDTIYQNNCPQHSTTKWATWLTRTADKGDAAVFTTPWITFRRHWSMTAKDVISRTRDSGTTSSSSPLGQKLKKEQCVRAYIVHVHTQQVQINCKILQAWKMHCIEGKCEYFNNNNKHNWTVLV